MIPPLSADTQVSVPQEGGCFLAHRFVHLELDVALEAEQLVLARGGQGLGAVRQEEEVVEEEGPQLPGAFGLVEAAAVQQPARPEAAGQRVEDQALKSESKVVMCGKTKKKTQSTRAPTRTEGLMWNDEASAHWPLY